MTLHTFNIYSDVCQLQLNKTRPKKAPWLLIAFTWELIFNYWCPGSEGTPGCNICRSFQLLPRSPHTALTVIRPERGHLNKQAMVGGVGKRERGGGEEEIFSFSTQSCFLISKMFSLLFWIIFNGSQKLLGTNHRTSLEHDLLQIYTNCFAKL